MLDALSRQDGWHMRMQQLARAAALSSSATTRLVTRLEDRGLLTRILCADDRRGIYTELTPAGSELLDPGPADPRPGAGRRARRGGADPGAGAAGRRPAPAARRPLTPPSLPGPPR